MLKRDYLLLWLSRFKFLYEHKNLNLGKKVGFKREDKSISQKIFKNFLRNRNKFLFLYFLKNPLLLLFFYFSFDFKFSLNYFFSFYKLSIIDVFNKFINLLKTSIIDNKLKNYIMNRLLFKRNKNIFKLIFCFIFKNKAKDKLKYIFEFLSFVKGKLSFLKSVQTLRNLIFDKKFNKLYFFFILEKIKKKYNLLNFDIKNFIYSKKKRYKFISFFLWIYKIFDKISLSYWLVFLILWLRSFVFFYFKIILTSFPAATSLRKIIVYSLFFFENYSNMIILEKKYSFKIYNKIINQFYVMRSFSFLLNYKFFKKNDFQHIKQISFYQDYFSHWHLNINRFAKFIMFIEMNICIIILIFYWRFRKRKVNKI